MVRWDTAEQGTQPGNRGWSRAGCKRKNADTVGRVGSPGTGINGRCTHTWCWPQLVSPVLTARLLHSAWLPLLPPHGLSLKDGGEENFFKGSND